MPARCGVKSRAVEIVMRGIAEIQTLYPVPSASVKPVETLQLLAPQKRYKIPRAMDYPENLDS